jgi:hypothetical protein
MHFDTHRFLWASLDARTTADAFSLIDIFRLGGGIDQTGIVFLRACMVTIRCFALLAHVPGVVVRERIPNEFGSGQRWTLLAMVV